MHSFLIVFGRPCGEVEYSKFLADVSVRAGKIGEIECLSENVFLCPAHKILPFVSSIAVRTEIENSRTDPYQCPSSLAYKILTLPEAPQWLYS